MTMNIIITFCHLYFTIPYFSFFKHTLELYHNPLLNCKDFSVIQQKKLKDFNPKIS